MWKIKIQISSLLLCFITFQATAQQHPGFSKLFAYSGDSLNRGDGIPMIIYDMETENLFFPLISFDQFGNTSSEFFKCDIDGNVVKQKIDTIENRTIRYHDLKELDGFIYWVGTIYSKYPIPDSINSKPIITKTDKDLNIIWRKELPNLERQGDINRIAVDKKRHTISLLMAKNTVNPNFYFPEVYPYLELARIDTLGVVLWSKIFGDQYYDNGMAMLIDEKGEHVITGRTYGWNANSSIGNPFLFKADNEGDELWHHLYEYGKPKVWNLGLLKARFSSTSYITVGQSSSNIQNEGYGYISKQDIIGNQIWSKNITFDNLNASFWDVVNTNDSGFLTCGTLEIKNDYTSGSTGLLVKLDQNGNELWNRRVIANPSSSKHHEYLFSLIEIPDGTFIAAGQSIGQNNRQYGWLVRVDSLGCTGLDCVPASINEVPLTKSDFNIFPNPTSDYFEIKAENITHEKLEVSILDITGRKLKKLTPSIKNVNRFNIEQFSSGIYVIEIKQKDKISYLKLSIK